jgi:hypothetical protein
MPEHKVHDVTLKAGIMLHEHVSVVKRREDRVVGFVETERESVSQSGAHLIEGKVHTQLVGATPQNEGDSLAVACILIRKLNSLGAHWSAPSLAAEPADCEAADTATPGRSLLVQITRLNLTNAFWRELNVSGSVEIQADTPRGGGSVLVPHMCSCYGGNGQETG